MTVLIVEVINAGDKSESDCDESESGGDENNGAESESNGDESDDDLQPTMEGKM